MADAALVEHYGGELRLGRNVVPKHSAKPAALGLDPLVSR